MLVNTALLTKQKVKDKANEYTALVLIISKGESKHQQDFISVKRQARHSRNLPFHLYSQETLIQRLFSRPRRSSPFLNAQVIRLPTLFNCKFKVPKSSHAVIQSLQPTPPVPSLERQLLVYLISQKLIQREILLQVS